MGTLLPLSGEPAALRASLEALPRLRLAHLPTPLLKVRALDDRLGCDVWIKRDDATAGAEAGNKIRKLELLLADALARGCDTVITCGGVQSNHARATALLAARLGLRCVLLLRVSDVAEPLPKTGNVLLDLLAGADIRRITADEYRARDQRMYDVAQSLAIAGRKPYVIPEGGSNGLGAIGYVLAMRELRGQIDAGLAGNAPKDRPFDVIAHACGSGGTAAGVLLGAHTYRIAARAIAFAVCDDAATFSRRIAGIARDACAIVPSLDAAQTPHVDDHARGPAYGVASDEQRALLADIARTSGVVLDPVYTGKAMHGLALAVRRGDVALGSRVLFIHTGGLPGLLAAGDAFDDLRG
ncbi:MAG: 1-aminocyclopropane-1-carboxylate deaminase/D-cysteine desulfhydrase [Polyangiales bacterium]